MGTFAAMIDYSEGAESQGGLLGTHWDSATLPGLMSADEVRTFSEAHIAAHSTQAIVQRDMSGPLYRLEGQELKAAAPDIKFETGVDGTAHMTVNGVLMRPEEAVERYGSAFDMDRRIEEAQVAFAQQVPQLATAALPMPSPSFM